MLYFVMGHVSHGRLHRQYAGLSKTAFAALPGPNVEFISLIVAYLNMKHCYLS